MLRHIAALTLLLTLTACDDPSADACPSTAPSLSIVTIDDADPDDLTFREQGPPWQWYVPTQMSFAQAEAIYTACKIKAPVIASVSGYTSDTTKPDEITLGWGVSFRGTTANRDCLIKGVIALGGVEVK